MKLKILIGVLVFLIAVNLATIGSYIYFQMQDSYAFKKRPDPENFPGRFPAPHLGLDHEQRRLLFELRKSFENETREYSDKIRELREDIFRTIKEDTVSMIEIEGRLDEISELRKQIEKIAVKKLLEARDHLSSGQRDHLFRFLLADPGHFNEKPPFQRKPGFRRGMENMEKPKNNINYQNNNKEK